MAYDDLRDWIKTLEKHGELRRIREEVSPELEITEITDRVSAKSVRVAGSDQCGRTAERDQRELLARRAGVAF